MYVPRFCKLEIHNLNLLLHCIQNVLCWIDIWLLRKTLEYNELIIMFKTPA